MSWSNYSLMVDAMTCLRSYKCKHCWMCLSFYILQTVRMVSFILHAFFTLSNNFSFTIVKFYWIVYYKTTNYCISDKQGHKLYVYRHKHFSCNMKMKSWYWRSPLKQENSNHVGTVTEYREGLVDSMWSHFEPLCKIDDKYAYSKIVYQINNLLQNLASINWCNLRLHHYRCNFLDSNSVISATNVPSPQVLVIWFPFLKYNYFL